MADEIVRVGVLGCGRIGRMHAELLARRISGVELVAVHDVVPAFAMTLAEELAVPALDSAADVLAAGVDAVAICTSTDTHVELITAAAAAGVAIFCEKPVSLDLAAVDVALGGRRRRRRAAARRLQPPLRPRPRLRATGRGVG